MPAKDTVNPVSRNQKKKKKNIHKMSHTQPTPAIPALSIQRQIPKFKASLVYIASTKSQQVGDSFMKKGSTIKMYFLNVLYSKLKLYKELKYVISKLKSVIRPYYHLLKGHFSG